MPDPYRIAATLYEDAGSGVYRGESRRDGAGVIIRTIRDDLQGPGGVKRLRREYEILSKMDSPYVLRPYGLDTQRRQPWLIMESFDGQPLSDQLGRPLAIDRFLEIALQLANALADIHRQGIVHKNLKPHNILIHPTTGAIKVIGFDLAAPALKSAIAPPSVSRIEGSLAYMSPEQTGRMNRGVDHRSDLYSLGVVFYELLAGELPFPTAEDDLELLHCHLARTPAPLQTHDEAIPVAVSQVVMKQLAKMPEDRYQTAGGLRADLERCAAEWQSHESIAPFPLGTSDVPGHLLIPKKLYGRRLEVGALLAAFGQVVASGRPTLVLLSGYSGIGKSAVVNELQKALVLPRALFAGGKPDQYKRDIPYATLAQALRALVRQVLGTNEEQIVRWRDAIQEAVGPNGRLVTDLVPDLVALIGEQPPVQDVPPQDAQNRFNTVFRRLLAAFARPGHPLVLFLDDLQWLDAATLRLLEHLVTHPAVEHILLLGAYRDNEVGPSHPLMLAFDSMRRAGAAVESIVLGPLTEEHVLQFTADAFHCGRERAEPLARLVYEKTGGNPFFMIQFVTELAHEGLVTFDDRVPRWQWDLDRVRGKGLTDNLADLMVGKLSRLSAETQQVLQHLACLGSRANLATMARVEGVAEEEIEKNLLQAIQAGFALLQDDSVAFLHDRVQEAAYALIPEGERPGLHLAIGRALLAKEGPEELGDDLFDVVSQLNRGADLMTEPAERARLAELNVAAGKRAQASIAYATARDCFAAAATLLSEETWDAAYGSTFNLYLDWAECAYLSGATDEAEPLLERLLARAQSALDRARVHGLRLTLYSVGGRYDDALAAGLQGLRLLGVEVPEDDGAINREIDAEAEAAAAKWKGRDIAGLAEAPAPSDPRIRAVIALLTNCGAPAYIGSRPQLFPLLNLKNVNYSLEFGPANESCLGYCGYV
jgi:predicted ATPase